MYMNVNPAQIFREIAKQFYWCSAIMDTYIFKYVQKSLFVSFYAISISG